MREKMKKAFMECYRAVLACEDETGRKRCELFREPPDKRVTIIQAIRWWSFMLTFIIGLPRLLSHHFPPHCTVASPETWQF